MVGVGVICKHSIGVRMLRMKSSKQRLDWFSSEVRLTCSLPGPLIGRDRLGVKLNVTEKKIGRCLLNWPCVLSERCVPQVENDTEWQEYWWRMPWRLFVQPQLEIGGCGGGIIRWRRAPWQKNCSHFQHWLRIWHLPCAGLWHEEFSPDVTCWNHHSSTSDVIFCYFDILKLCHACENSQVQAAGL